MSTDSEWILRAAEGDEAAFQWVFDRYFQRLVGVARRKLVSVPPQIADEEGAVVSAMRSFFSGIVGEQFPQLTQEAELWRLLTTITVRKAINQVRRHWKQKGEANAVDRTADVDALLDASLLGPDEIVAFVDHCQQMIDSLPDDSLKQIALYRLEGRETREIAQLLDVHQRTVQRKSL